jgi:tripartite-type tricarboxylate transporter receptor subunit TctC
MTTAVFFIGSLGLMAPAQADEVEDFYKDKTVNVLIGYPPGGGPDLTARLLARHMNRHIPGSPKMLARNVPGAASLILTNQLFNTAPKDGTTFGMIGSSVPFGPLWSREGVNFEPTELSWIGSFARQVGIVAMWQASPVLSLEQATTTEALVGATGSGDVTAIYPRVLNALLGTKFKVVSGYQGTAELNGAIERGEVHGRMGWCWDCLKADKPDWFAGGKVKVIAQLALAKDPDMGNIPLALDLAKNEDDKQIMRLVFGNHDMARPYIAPPGVPAARLAALRKAFEDTMKDPLFLAEAKQIGSPINPVSWQAQEQQIRDAYATPRHIVERSAQIVNGN